MPPRPAQLMDELVEEVLLRLPPDNPASLIRAGLVCKRWHHLVSDPGFRRRFSDFHGRRRGAPPPMLGFMTYSHGATRFIPNPDVRPHHHDAIASSSSNLICRGWSACDARHGRVLLLGNTDEPKYQTSIRMAVWNPITGDQLHLPEPPPRWKLNPNDEWNAAVLCAAAGGASCDHLGCHSGPCVVVLVGTKSSKNFACVYSSESGAWSEEPTFVAHRPPHSGRASVDGSVRSALVGNTLYFALHEPDFYNRNRNFDMYRRNFYVFNHRNILEYDLVTRRMSVVELPRACGGPRFDLTIVQEPFAPIELTTMEDDDNDGRLRLGFVRVEHYSTLYLWSRDEGRPAGWVLRKTIQLNHLTPPYRGGRRPWESLNKRYLVGSAEGVGVIFLALKGQLFTIDLRSSRVTMVYSHKASCLTVPYINFCTPVFRVLSSSLAGEKRTDRVPQVTLDDMQNELPS